MIIRNAVIKDVPMIHDLVSEYSELDRMLYRSLSDIYENLQVFHVAELNDIVVGCCALKVIWSDLAEIQTLAVERESFGQGIGRSLIEACLNKARQLGINKVFTLTLEPEFFAKLGFKKVDRLTLPMKVWTDCARCPKQDHCDEIALIYNLDE